MTIKQSLKAINGYPIPHYTLQDITEFRGLNLDSEMNIDIRKQVSFRLAQSDVLIWLSKAPNVSQAGISYTFTDEDRKRLRAEAEAISEDCGIETLPSSVVYGYKGENL